MFKKNQIKLICHWRILHRHDTPVVPVCPLPKALKGQMVSLSPSSGSNPATCQKPHKRLGMRQLNTFITNFVVHYLKKGFFEMIDCPSFRAGLTFLHTHLYFICFSSCNILHVSHNYQGDIAKLTLCYKRYSDLNYYVMYSTVECTCSAINA